MIGACGHVLPPRRRAWCSDECAGLNARELWLNKTYNITRKDYAAIVAAQGDQCPICLKPLNDKVFHVDHDHKTGVVCGVICPHCNTRILGRNRNPDVYQRAADYLRNPPAVAVIGERVAPGRPKRRRGYARRSVRRKTRPAAA